MNLSIDISSFYIASELFGYDIYSKDDEIMNADWELIAKFSCKMEIGGYVIRKSTIKEKKIETLRSDISDIKHADKIAYKAARNSVGDYVSFSTCHALFSHEEVSTGFN